MSSFQKIAIDLLLKYLVDNLGQYHAITLRLLVKNARDLSENENFRRKLRGILTFLNRKPQYLSAIALLRAIKEETGQTKVACLWTKLEEIIAQHGYLRAMNQLKSRPEKNLYVL